ncbi:uncharacterized protein LOC143034909 [Oratosquilla oratoria]|uniref:uncharacterized protein LOC143034909 n=1 Tax=Oratosquilla oratoria TaxID=337810 RepID=UPI003F76DB11
MTFNPSILAVLLLFVLWCSSNVRSSRTSLDIFEDEFEANEAKPKLAGMVGRWPEMKPQSFYKPSSGRSFPVSSSSSSSSFSYPPATFKKETTKKNSEMIEVQRRGFRQILNASYLDMKLWSTYSCLPNLLVNMTDFVSRSDICRDMNVPLTFDGGDLGVVDPSWVSDTSFLGLCPMGLRSRRLPTNYEPKVIVEGTCPCAGSRCSVYGGGYECVAVKRNVPVWIKLSNRSVIPDVIYITVACVCAQRPSRPSAYTDTPIIES